MRLVKPQPEGIDRKGKLSTNDQAMWIIDSGCSKHMTGQKNAFSKLESRNQGHVSFGHGKGRIEGIGSIQTGSDVSISNVLYVPVLKFNLLSVSQLCDHGFIVQFGSENCKVLKDDSVILEGVRKDNIYVASFVCNTSVCLTASFDITLMWHRRLGHVNIRLLQKLASNKLVHGLPKSLFDKHTPCNTCCQGKMTRNTFKSKSVISSDKPLQLVHIDLFGKIEPHSLSHKQYCCVIVDDFTRFTWVLFLRLKSDTTDEFFKWCRKTERKLNTKLISIRSDHGGEFIGAFEDECEKHGFDHNFSVARTPQQNGVVERKNRVLQEMSRTMLLESGLPKQFWAEAVACACWISNRCYLRPKLIKLLMNF